MCIWTTVKSLPTHMDYKVKSRVLGTNLWSTQVINSHLFDIAMIYLLIKILLGNFLTNLTWRICILTTLVIKYKTGDKRIKTRPEVPRSFFLNSIYSMRMYLTVKFIQSFHQA